MSQPVIALAGNPNAGKTTLFNGLTGGHYHVGNYAGVTVETREGQLVVDDVKYRLVDLPGIYSLTADSVEEHVARQFLVEEQPSVVLAVVDAGNLERNLYLVTQLMELGLPMVLVLNMMDEAREKGWDIDLQAMSQRLKMPVVGTVGFRKEGVDTIRSAIRSALEQSAEYDTVHFCTALEREILALEPKIESLDRSGLPLRLSAVRLLEGDSELEPLVEAQASEISGYLEESRQRIQLESNHAPDLLVADARYGFAAGLCKECITHNDPVSRLDASERIDDVLMHPVFGLPIFLGIMYMVFWLTFQVGEWPMRGLEALFGLAKLGLANAWPETASPMLLSILTDGVLGGVGGVVVFLPNIMILFFCMSILEQSGYMARATFLMDGFMHRIGLHGRSFIPMVMGLGCSVPAIMAARTIDNPRDRLATIMAVPLVPCGARLPVFLLLVPAFFAEPWRGAVMFLVYLSGIAMAVLVAFLLRKTVFGGEMSHFVMELPPYRKPGWKGLLRYTWRMGALYLKKAGTVILLFSLALWALANFPRVSETRHIEVARALEAPVDSERVEAEIRRVQLEESILGHIGRAMEPVFAPAGFDWRISTAILGATAAKEVFVAQLGVIFSIETGGDDSHLSSVLHDAYSLPAGFAVVFFMLLTFPCVSTLVVTYRETGKLRYPLFQFGGLMFLAWLVAVILYQVLTFFGA